MDYKYFLLAIDKGNLQLIRVDDVEFVTIANGRVFQSVLNSDTPIVVFYRDPDGVYTTESSQILALSNDELDALLWEDKEWPATQE